MPYTLETEQQVSYDYSQYKEGPADNILARIAEAARNQRDAERVVVEAEEALNRAKAALARIAEVQLPGLMEEARQTSLTTEDGILVEVGEQVRASIPKDRAPEAFAWLRANQHAGLIRHEYKIAFNKDEDDRAEAFAQQLREAAQRFEEKRYVHPSTLVAFVKARLEEGTPLPLDAFGVFRQKIARVKTRD